MKPMLLTPIGAATLLDLCRDDRWVLQEKIDGVRAAVVILSETDGMVYKRGGNRRRIKFAAPTTLPPQTVVDGEVVGRSYHYFDFLTQEKDTSPYFERLRRLHENADAVTGIAEKGSQASVVRTYAGAVNKLQAAMAIKAAGGEGVVMRNLHGVYRQGIRSVAIAKFKFTHTVNCRILAANEDGKANFVLGCWDEWREDFVKVGVVSALSGDGPLLKPGDDCTVTYLCLTAKGLLREPVSPIRFLANSTRDLSIRQLHPEGDPK